MTAIVIAALAAIGFSGSSLLALFQRPITARSRACAIAIAAGVLLVITFGDLFPESLELAGDMAIIGFLRGFAFLYLVESLTHGHTHHAPDEDVQQHALAPYVVGLAIHNIADGFAVGVSMTVSNTVAELVGFGILVHQVPVGLSLAAVFVAARATRPQVLWGTILLGLAIPLAALITVVLPNLDVQASDVLTSIASGVLAYMAAAHLLPEAQAEHPSRITTVVFITTIIIMTIGVFTLFRE